MTPLSFEWLWNIEYFLFMGLLYLALTVIGCGILYTLIKTWLDLGPEEKEDGESTPGISYRSRYTEF
jgi:hypothetical protein